PKLYGQRNGSLFRARTDSHICIHRDLLQPSGVTSHHSRLPQNEANNFTLYLAPITTARELRKELPPYSFEEFDVKLDTFIKWRFGSSSSKSVRVSCNEVPVGLVVMAR
ncbi:hypothetical protein HID58_034830, partial [Brassica napus]